VDRSRPRLVAETIAILIAGVIALVLVGWAFGDFCRAFIPAHRIEVLDGPFYRVIHSRATPAAGTVASAVSVTAVSGTLAPLILLVGLALRLFWRTWRPLVLLGGAFLGANATSNLIKILVNRPRPPYGPGTFFGSSFPSGHSTYVVAVYGMAAVLVSERFRGWIATAAWTIAALLAAAVGTSRVYLGAHYPTDVIAGFLLGASWVLLMRWGDHRARVIADAPPAAGEEPSAAAHTAA
jgi:undecaprenyl-diphosphatase